MTSTSADKILDRLVKLFALAENNPNANEAQAALLMAQRLMIEHAISEDAIRARGEQSEFRDTINADYATEDDAGRVRKDPFAIRLAVVIGEYFRVKAYSYCGRAKFAGYGNDRKVAQIVYGFALKTMEEKSAGYMIAWKTLRPHKPTTGESRTERQTWCDGFVNGLRDGFAKQLAANPQWLAILQIPTEVTVWIEKNLNLRSVGSASRVLVGGNARESGAQHGRDFAAQHGGSSRNVRGLLR